LKYQTLEDRHFGPSPLPK